MGLSRSPLWIVRTFSFGFIYHSFYDKRQINIQNYHLYCLRGLSPGTSNNNSLITERCQAKNEKNLQNRTLLTCFLRITPYSRQRPNNIRTNRNNLRGRNNFFWNRLLLSKPHLRWMDPFGRRNGRDNCGI